MRITAGKYKGKRLLENKFEHIRPTADVVKQAIFNNLSFKISSDKVLDLCAGTGALGIEAISRFSREVVFVDNDKRSVKLISENLKNLGEHAKVLNMSALDAIKYLSGTKFDIIIFDPPYKSDLYEKVLKLILEKELLEEDGVIVCEHAKEDEFDWQGFSVEKEKIYGIKKVTYLTN